MIFLNKMKLFSCILLVLIIFACSQNSTKPEPEENTDWTTELGYSDTDLVPISLDQLGMPEVTVQFGDTAFPLLFDFGTSGNLWITTELEDAVEHTVLGEAPTLNADGSYRGTVKTITIPHVSVFDKTYDLLNTKMADYTIYSNVPFNGAVGLNTLAGQRFTVAYQQGIMAYTNTPLPADVSSDSSFEVLPLVTFDYHPHGLHVLGEVNGVKGIVYFDSGYNHSWVDTKILDANLLSGGTHQKYNGTVTVKVGDLTIPVENPYAKDMQRDLGDYEYPARFLVGSDLLKYVVMTIDRTNGQNRMIIHKSN